METSDKERIEEAVQRYEKEEERKKEIASLKEALRKALPYYWASKYPSRSE